MKLHLAPLDPLGTFLPGDGLGPEGGLEDREEAVSFQHSNLHLLFLFFFCIFIAFFFFLNSIYTRIWVSEVVSSISNGQFSGYFMI